MSNDLFGGLGGLMKGLSGLMPQDDPAVRLMNAQSEVGDLQAQESAIYTEIGKLVFSQNPEAFPAQANRLRLVQANLAEAEAKLKSETQAKQAAERAERDAQEHLNCPECGHQNPEGVRFCQECGAKLGSVKAICPACGQDNAPGVRFCGGCGQKIG